MGRYVNWFLIAVGVAAGALLTIEGVLAANILNPELSELLCVVTAVPPVIAVIRMENARRIESTSHLGDTIAGEIRAVGDRLQAAMAETSKAHAEEMIRAVGDHADRTCKNIHERTLAVLAEANMKAARDVEQMHAVFSDTGPFPAVR